MRFSLVCIALVVGSVRSEDSPYDRYVQAIHRINESPFLKKELERHYALFQSRREIDYSPSLFAAISCPGNFRSPTKPTSVHQLLPGDIDVVSAMGDSLTAANGASAWTILGCLTEYRGRAFSIGGDKDVSTVVTLPNILKKFNPNLKGFSTDKGDVNSSGAKLNVAYPGKIAQDMPGQARLLIERIRADKTISFNEDWKMVTLFIGGNNLCAFCNDGNKHSENSYIASVRESLDILAAGLPRAYVNLVEIFDITPVAQLANGVICNVVHNSVCGCGHGSGADLPALRQLSLNYQRVTQELLNSGRYDGREDFVVVLQPFLRNTVPPTKPGSADPDLSYFAPDCFHFSEKGHNSAGKALWNNLLQPIGQKSTDWDLSSSVQCPAQGRFLPTSRN